MSSYTRQKGYVILKHHGRYIVFRDARTKEITMAGGGCGRNNGHNRRNCARRELKEESKGALNLKRNNLRPAFNFISNVRFNGESKTTNDGKKILQHYHVFNVNVKEPFNDILKRFHASKAPDKEMNQINLVNLNNNKVHWWNFMKTHFLPRMKKDVSSPPRLLTKTQSNTSNRWNVRKRNKTPPRKINRPLSARWGPVDAPKRNTGRW